MGSVSETRNIPVSTEEFLDIPTAKTLETRIRKVRFHLEIELSMDTILPSILLRWVAEVFSSVLINARPWKQVMLHRATNGSLRKQRQFKERNNSVGAANVVCFMRLDQCIRWQKSSQNMSCKIKTVVVFRKLLYYICNDCMTRSLKITYTV